MARAAMIDVWLLLLIFCHDVSAITLSAPIACTYANSTCSTCSQRPCTRGESFPLLPSACHPDYQSLVINHTEYHPDRAPPSFQLPDETGFSVPPELFPPSASLDNIYTISIYFRITRPENHGILLHIEDENSELLLSLANQAIHLTDSQELSLSLSLLGDDWMAVFIEVGGRISLTLDGTSNSTLMPKTFIETFSNVTIGENFTGYIQDFIVYIPAVSQLPQTAQFLSQCYCQGNLSVDGQCSDGEKFSPRFLNTSRIPTDFGADTSRTTVWSSGDSDSPVSYVVGLNTSLNLSKIFVTFSSFSAPPQKVVLQFLSISDSFWKDLQYFAEDCNTSFGVSPDAKLVDATSVNCLEVPMMDSLIFLLGGSEVNPRPPIEQNSLYFLASQVRIIMEGRSNYSIESFQVCPEFCLDLVPSCTCISPTSVTSVESTFVATTDITSLQVNTSSSSSSISVESPTPSSMEGAPSGMQAALTQTVLQLDRLTSSTSVPMADDQVTTIFQEIEPTPSTASGLFLTNVASTATSRQEIENSGPTSISGSTLGLVDMLLPSSTDAPVISSMTEGRSTSSTISDFDTTPTSSNFGFPVGTAAPVSTPSPSPSITSSVTAEEEGSGSESTFFSFVTESSSTSSLPVDSFSSSALVDLAPTSRVDFLTLSLGRTGSIGSSLTAKVEPTFTEGSGFGSTSLDFESSSIARSSVLEPVSIVIPSNLQQESSLIEIVLTAASLSFSGSSSQLIFIQETPTPTSTLQPMSIELTATNFEQSFVSISESTDIIESTQSSNIGSSTDMFSQVSFQSILASSPVVTEFTTSSTSPFIEPTPTSDLVIESSPTEGSGDMQSIDSIESTPLFSRSDIGLTSSQGGSEIFSIVETTEPSVIPSTSQFGFSSTDFFGFVTLQPSATSSLLESSEPGVTSKVTLTSVSMSLDIQPSPIEGSGDSSLSFQPFSTEGISFSFRSSSSEDVFFSTDVQPSSIETISFSFDEFRPRSSEGISFSFQPSSSDVQPSSIEIISSSFDEVQPSSSEGISGPSSTSSEGISFSFDEVQPTSSEGLSFSSDEVQPSSSRRVSFSFDVQPSPTEGSGDSSGDIFTVSDIGSSFSDSISSISIQPSSTEGGDIFTASDIGSNFSESISSISIQPSSTEGGDIFTVSDIGSNFSESISSISIQPSSTEGSGDIFTVSFSDIGSSFSERISSISIQPSSTEGGDIFTVGFSDIGSSFIESISSISILASSTEGSGDIFTVSFSDIGSSFSESSIQPSSTEGSDDIFTVSFSDIGSSFSESISIQPSSTEGTGDIFTVSFSDIGSSFSESISIQPSSTEGTGDIFTVSFSDIGSSFSESISIQPSSTEGTGDIFTVSFSDIGSSFSESISSISIQPSSTEGSGDIFTVSFSDIGSSFSESISSISIQPSATEGSGDFPSSFEFDGGTISTEVIESVSASFDADSSLTSIDISVPLSIDTTSFPLETPTIISSFDIEPSISIEGSGDSISLVDVVPSISLESVGSSAVAELTATFVVEPTPTLPDVGPSFTEGSGDSISFSFDDSMLAEITPTPTEAFSDFVTTGPSSSEIISDVLESSSSELADVITVTSTPVPTEFIGSGESLFFSPSISFSILSSSFFLESTIQPSSTFTSEISGSTSSFPFSSFIVQATSSDLFGSGSGFSDEIFGSTVQEFSIVSSLELTTTMAPFSTSSLEQTPEPTITSTTEVSLPVSSSISATPLPSPISLACPQNNSSHPFVPVKVRPVGFGFIDQPIQSISMLEYFTSLVTNVRPDIAQTSRVIRVQVGESFTSIVNFTDSRTRSYNISGTTSREEVYHDSPHVTVAVQVRDDSFSTNVERDITVVLTNPSQDSITHNCSIDVVFSGVCKVTVTNIPSEWFLTDRDNNISISASVIGVEGITPIGSFTLKARTPLEISNTIYTVLPRHSVAFPEDLEVPVYASYSTLLLGFSLDCKLEGPASITGAKASIQWSLLTEFNATSRQIAVTGFRNYNKSNINDTGMVPDHLFNLSISIADVTTSITVCLECEVFKLAFTNGTELQSRVTSLPQVNISADGCITLDHSRILDLFGYAQHNELLNTRSIIENNALEVELHVIGFYSNGSLLPTIAFCSSQDNDVVQVSSNCSTAYFTGNETSGSERVNIVISTPDGEMSVLLPLKIWYSSPSDVEIHIEDTELNLVSCLDAIYQRTPFSITAAISTDPWSDDRQLVVTDYLLPFVTSSNESLVTVSNGSLRGIQEGTVRVYLSHLQDEGPHVEVSVSDDPVGICSLEVFEFSGIDVEITSNSPSQGVNISLLQNFHYVNSDLYLIGVILYSDGHRMEVDGIDFQVESSGIEAGRLPNSYVIVTPPSEINISAEWSSGACQIASEEKVLNVDNVSIPSLEVIPSSRTLIPLNDSAGLIFNNSSSLELKVELRYQDNFTVSISDNSTLHFSPPDCLLRLGDGRVTASSGCNRSTVLITVQYRIHSIILNSSVVIEIKTMIEFNLTAYYPNTDIEVDRLGQIGESGMIQQAEIKANMYFSDGTIQDVTFMTSITIIDDPLSIAHINKSKIVIGQSLPVEQYDIVLQGTLFDGLITGNLTIQVTNQSVQIRSINAVSLNRSATANKLYINCNITLSDHYQIEETFREGAAVYPNLITFITDDDNSEFIQLNPINGTITLVNNSISELSVTAIASGMQPSENSSISFYSNLLPGLAEVDLGNNSIFQKPLRDIKRDEVFTVPVIVNSNATSVGVYEVNICYEPSDALELESVVQGENWKNGSLVYIEKEGVITLSGVLNTGAKGSAVELAVLSFKTCRACSSNTVNFSVITLSLYEANVTLEEIVPTTTSLLVSQVQVQILAAAHQVTRRSAIELDTKESRKRRETEMDCVMFPSEDYNRDCKVDLRDVYLLQVYLASEVYNFTSSARAMQVFQTTGIIPSASVSQITDIEKGSLNVNFNVTDISYRYFMEPNSQQCMQQIYGVVQTPTGERVPANSNFVHVVLAFSSLNSSFQEDFYNANFSGHVVVTDRQILLEPMIEESNGKTVFEVDGNVFTVEEFEIEVIIIVELEGTSVGTVSLVGSIYSDIVKVLNETSANNSCIPSTATEETTEALATEETTEALTTEETTEALTTEQTTEALTTEETTEVVTTEEITEALTTEETTEALTTEETTEALTTEETTEALTTEETTEVVTTEETTEALATEETTEALTTEETTEALTTEETTEVVTTEETTEALTTEEITEAPTTEETTEVVTTGETTEALTTEETTEALTTEETTEVVTTEETTEALTTEETTEVVTAEETTEALTTEETTEALTTEETTEALTTEETTEALTTEETTEVVTTEETTEALTTEETTEVVTTEETTEVLTTEGTTETPTTEETTEVVTTEGTTEALITEETTEVVTTEETTEALTTEETTEVVTTEETTEVVATEETAEALTTKETTEVVTTEETTEVVATEETAEALTTKETTEALTTKETTEALTTEETTKVVTTEETTEALTTKETAEALTTKETTEALTTEETTKVVTTEETTEAVTTEMNTSRSSTEITSSMTTQRTQDSTDAPSSPPSSSLLGPILGVLAVIVVILLLIIIFISLVWGVRKHRRKKGSFQPSAGHTTSRVSQNFWFNEEEKIEMSPIDIVPLEENMYGPDIETNMDIVPIHRIYHSEKTDTSMYSNYSNMPLVHSPSKHQAQNIPSKEIHPSLLETPIDPPPPYVSAATGRSEATASSYEMEEDDIFDFKFDDAQTQPYLSLGLTPPSQLSPQDPGQTFSGGDSYYFPSMLPPVTPISSVFSINESGSSVGISVDADPFSISSGSMVMPEANPVAEPQFNGSSRRTAIGRKSKHDHVNAHSQGYAMKLETVPEQSCSLDDSFSDRYSDPLKPRNMTSNMDSSSSSAEESNNLLHRGPSIDCELPRHLRRKAAAGKRRKSGTRRVLEEDNWVPDKEATTFRNRNVAEPLDHPVKLCRDDSPRTEERNVRKQMREQELERQKEILKRKMMEEERARLTRQDQRAAKIIQDYGATRQHGGRHGGELVQSSNPSNLVMQETMRYEAQLQILKQQDSSSAAKAPQTFSPRRSSEETSSSNNVIKTSNQFSVL